jgi:hypothetical protein
MGCAWHSDYNKRICKDEGDAIHVVAVSELGQKERSGTNVTDFCTLVQMGRLYGTCALFCGGREQRGT